MVTDLKYQSFTVLTSHPPAALLSISSLHCLSCLTSWGRRVSAGVTATEDAFTRSLLWSSHGVRFLLNISNKRTNLVKGHVINLRAALAARCANVLMNVCFSWTWTLIPITSCIISAELSEMIFNGTTRVSQLTDVVVPPPPPPAGLVWWFCTATETTTSRSWCETLSRSTENHHRRGAVSFQQHSAQARGFSFFNRAEFRLFPNP